MLKTSIVGNSFNRYQLSFVFESVCERHIITRMELLQSYDVSSGESEEDNENVNNNKLKCEAEMKKGNVQEIQKDTNYFGIEHNSSYSDDSSCDGSNNKDGELEIGGLRVEIPDSDFWRELKAEDVKQIKSDASKILSHLPLEKSESSPAKWKQVGLNKNSQTVREQSSKETKLDYSSKSNETVSLQRKIFYIHSKIQPKMHTLSSNFPPEKLDRHIDAHGGVVNRVKWNVPSFSHLFLSTSMDSCVKIWNAFSAESACVRNLMHHGKAVKDAEWSHDGRSILSCSYDRSAVVTDVETGKQVCKLEHAGYVTCGKFNPVRRSQVVTGSTNSLQHWDIRTPHTACKNFQYHDDLGQMQDVLFTKDGNQFFSCSDMVTRDSADRNVMAWDFSSGVPLSNQIYQERYACVRLKLHPTSSHFLAQSHGRYVAIFSTSRPYKMVRSKRFEGHTLLGYSIGFDVSRDGSLVVSGSSDGRIHFYDYQTGKLKKQLTSGLDVCMDVMCHPVLASTVVCCSWDGGIRIFH
ncbi:WD repeat-containing protein 25-like [Haliotis rubra]|uniref:WD repeat-containing protein 25-like n=1 Tax=Haliotis rubra TaxID=36100 RepID=UPI001EE54547|nr:WD repeat-containing protein 25-like [Haliotis rubra]